MVHPQRALAIVPASILDQVTQCTSKTITSDLIVGRRLRTSDRPHHREALAERGRVVVSFHFERELLDYAVAEPLIDLNVAVASGLEVLTYDGRPASGVTYGVGVGQGTRTHSNETRASRSRRHFFRNFF